MSKTVLCDTYRLKKIHIRISSLNIGKLPYILIKETYIIKRKLLIKEFLRWRTGTFS